MEKDSSLPYHVRPLAKIRANLDALDLASPRAFLS